MTSENPRWSLSLPGGFFCAGVVAFSGLLLDLVTMVRPGDAVSAPLNRYAWIVFLAIILTPPLILKRGKLLYRSTLIPLAIGATGFYILSGVILGFLPQLKPSSVPAGLTTVLSSHLSSWMFAFVQLYFLFILGLSVGNHIRHGKPRKVLFVLMHLGLLIALSGGYFGAPELQRLRMTLHKGRHVWYGITPDRHEVELDFSLRMLDFKIQTHPPRPGIKQGSADGNRPRMYTTTAQLIARQGVDRRVNIQVNRPIKVNGWHVYQSGFRPSGTGDGFVSFLEAVRDPWLPMVYTGIYMLLAGAVLMFFQGVRKK